jgi:hypothetical protein
MSEIAKLLRFAGPATHEFKISAIDLGNISGELFTSSLTSGNSRIGFYAYNNNSSSTSGEIYWGDSTVAPDNGFPIPVGAVVEIPVVADLDVYFIATSGEFADLRVLELA